MWVLKAFAIGFMITCGIFIVAYLLSELTIKNDDKEDIDDENKT